MLNYSYISEVNSTCSHFKKYTNRDNLIFHLGYCKYVCKYD